MRCKIRKSSEIKHYILVCDIRPVGRVRSLDTKVYDEVIPVSNEDSFEYSKYIAKEEGVLVGISSGAALKAAIEVAKRPEFKGKTVVALLPDSGDRYYSTDLFKD